MKYFLILLGAFMIFGGLGMQSMTVACTGLIVLVLVWACGEITRAIKGREGSESGNNWQRQKNPPQFEQSR